MKRIFLFLLSFVSILGANAVEPIWDVDFGCVFDNREGDHSMTDTETIFFTRLAPEVGLKFTPADYIAGGVVWVQPIGNQWHGSRISPTLYYRHEQGRWAGSLGMFPRSQLRQELPGFLWSDSLAYFQNNIRGALLQYDAGRSFVDFYLDWRQRQTSEKREAFNIVVHGNYAPFKFPLSIGAHVMMNHFALTRPAREEDHIVDNFLVNPYVGYDAGGSTALDTLSFRTGAVITIERNRALSKWQTPAGFWLEAIAEYKRFGLKNSLYAGGKLLPSYSQFGSTLYPGEPFYQSSFYNRTDIYYAIIRNKYMQLDASLNFNAAKGSFIFYQRIMLSVRI